MSVKEHNSMDTDIKRDLCPTYIFIHRYLIEKKNNMKKKMKISLILFVARPTFLPKMTYKKVNNLTDFEIKLILFYLYSKLDFSKYFVLEMYNS